MDRSQRPTSVIDTLGEEIVRIITPVSICMILVVLLVLTLNNPNPSSPSDSITMISGIAFNENSSDSIWDKLKGALLNSLVFVAVVTIMTFFLVFLFYIRCTSFLKYYMGFSAFVILGITGGQIGLMLIDKLNFPIDIVTFSVLMLNFAVLGVLAVFLSKMAILVTQGYLVVIGVLAAYWFTMLPEWTTWVLLVAMSIYDLAAVLLPGGPLRLLVEMAMTRDEDIPALVYEARPIYDGESTGVAQRRLWRERVDDVENLELNASFRAPSLVGNGENGRDLGGVEEGRSSSYDHEPSVPLLEERMSVERRVQGVVVSDEGMALEGIGLGSSGAIKLGLGDFIFYSVLVGRAAMYDFMTVYACYLAIIAGLGITLMLLAMYQKALPALPVSVLLGVVFYVLTRTLLEEFMVQCSINFLMF